MVMPVWRTTPVTAMFRDAGLPMAEDALEEARYRFGHRLRSADRRNPIVARITGRDIIRGRGAGGTQRLRTALQHAANKIEIPQRPILREPRFTPGCRIDPTRGLTKAQAAKDFVLWYDNLPGNNIVVFSDGSQEGRTNIGYGYAVYQGEQLLGSGNGRLDECSINFDAEAVGAWRGLEWATLNIPGIKQLTTWVCLDNTGVIWGQRGNAAPSSQWAYHKFHKVMDTQDVKVKWCPGHCNIPGNELADKLAKQGSKLPDTDRDCTTTVYGVKSKWRRQMNNERGRRWDKRFERTSERYQSWGLEVTTRCPRALTVLSRRMLHRYLAVRTGHGDFAWYHTKFQHDDAKLECACGMAKEPTHLVRCKYARITFAKWPDPPPWPPREDSEQMQYLQVLLDDPEKFKRFVEVTEYYTKYGGR